MSSYRDRSACLTTKHGKAHAIAKAVRSVLGLQLFTPTKLDTDIFGTFSGEIPRRSSARDVCEKKARFGMAVTGLALGIANEGSFGPHPYIPFVAAAIELMTFVDDERKIVIAESLVSDRTNFSHRLTHSLDEISEWLPTAGFPTHALVVLPNVNLSAPAEKGIVSIERLRASVTAAAANSVDGLARVETDMRAHLNPTRMVAIRRLARRFANRLATNCPNCASPGWGQIGVTKGLPCELCGSPTGWAIFEVSGCVACDYCEQKPRNDGLQHAAPQHCPECNP